MACCNSNENATCNNYQCGSNFNYVTLLILYILLAIIIGTAFCF